MADSPNNPATKAERMIRRALERLGSVVDNKLAPGGQARLSPSEFGQLIARLEEAIESNLTRREGSETIAPNHLRVLLTYEVHTRLGHSYVEGLAEELKNAAYEFINDRRYRLLTLLVVEVQPDLFAKGTQVVALSQPEPESKSDSAGKPDTGIQATVALRDERGRTYDVKFTSDGAPIYVGRAAGNSVRIDDNSISRIHASLVRRPGGQIAVADLNSANGTFVNGCVVNHGEARTLEIGDTICFGDVKLTVQAA